MAVHLSNSDLSSAVSLLRIFARVKMLNVRSEIRIMILQRYVRAINTVINKQV